MLSEEQQYDQAAELRQLQVEADRNRQIVRGAQKKELKAEAAALKKEIKKLKKFDEDFYSILFVSMFMDIIGIMPMGMTAIFANFPMWLFLAMKLYGHHAMARRFFLALFLEFVLSWAPIYTVAALWIKSNVDRKISRLSNQVRKIEKKMKL